MSVQDFNTMKDEVNIRLKNLNKIYLNSINEPIFGGGTNNYIDTILGSTYTFKNDSNNNPMIAVFTNTTYTPTSISTLDENDISDISEINCINLLNPSNPIVVKMHGLYTLYAVLNAQYFDSFVLNTKNNDPYLPLTIPYYYNDDGKIGFTGDISTGLSVSTGWLARTGSSTLVQNITNIPNFNAFIARRIVYMWILMWHFYIAYNYYSTDRTNPNKINLVLKCLELLQKNSDQFAYQSGMTNAVQSSTDAQIADLKYQLWCIVVQTLVPSSLGTLNIENGTISPEDNNNTCTPINTTNALSNIGNNYNILINSYSSITDDIKDDIKDEFTNILNKITDTTNQCSTTDKTLQSSAIPSNSIDVDLNPKDITSVKSFTTKPTISVTNPSYTFSFDIKIEKISKSWRCIMVHGINSNDRRPAIFITGTDQGGIANRIYVIHNTTNKANFGFISTKVITVGIYTNITLVVHNNKISLYINGIYENAITPQNSNLKLDFNQYTDSWSWNHADYIKNNTGYGYIYIKNAKWWNTFLYLYQIQSNAGLTTLPGTKGITTSISNIKLIDLSNQTSQYFSATLSYRKQPTIERGDITDETLYDIKTDISKNITTYRDKQSQINRLGPAVSKNKDTLKTTQLNLSGRKEQANTLKIYEYVALTILLLITIFAFVIISMPLEKSMKIILTTVLTVIVIINAYLLQTVFNKTKIEKFALQQGNDDISVVTINYMDAASAYLSQTETLNIMLESNKVYNNTNQSLSRELTYFNDISDQLVNSNDKVDSVYKSAYITQVEYSSAIQLFKTLSVVIAGFTIAFVALESLDITGSPYIWISCIAGFVSIIALVIYILEVNTRVHTNPKQVYWGKPSKTSFN